MPQEIPMENVCLTVAGEENGNFFFPYQFVYETLPGALIFPRNMPCWGCHLVTEGEATLVMEDVSYPLQKGDLFFTFYCLPYSLEHIRGIKYLYISFIGNGVTEKLTDYGVQPKQPVRHGMGDLIDHWFGGVGKCTEENLTTLTSGILYYTLALLTPLQVPSDDTSAEKQTDNVITAICSLIEQGYGNSALNLNYVCKLYNYHPKYISRRFREVVGSSFSEYLQACRMAQACKLLRETNRTIREIAAAVGYQNQLYFSRVFRKCYSVSPSEYRLGKE